MRLAPLAASPGFATLRTAPAAEQQDDAPATWRYSRNFTFFVTDPAGATGSVQASVQGHAYSPASAYSVAARPVSSVMAVLRTAVLYADRSALHAAYVLRDSEGRSLVSSSGLAVLMTAAGPLGTLTSAACTHAANGVGDCSLTVSDGWFSSAGASQVSVEVQVFYSNVLTASGAAGNATLAASPVHTAVATPGLLAVLPHSPRFRTDQFSVPITAHTNPAEGFALKAWSLRLAWNTSTLELASFSSSSLYASPTTNQDDAAGTLQVAVVGTQASHGPGPSPFHPHPCPPSTPLLAQATTSLSDVTGTAVLLLTATFRVRSGAAESHNCTNAVALTALEFLNQGNFLFVENAAAQINDARGGAQSEGQLSVEQVVPVGQRAHSDSVDIVNTAALSGSAVQRSVLVTEFYSRAATGAADVTADFSCSSSDAAVLGTSGCTLQLDGNETGGA